MKETTHKYKDNYVILRFDENEKDWRTNWRSEYWTWDGWKPWPDNAKQFLFEEWAEQELISIRIKRAALLKW